MFGRLVQCPVQWVGKISQMKSKRNGIRQSYTHSKAVFEGETLFEPWYDIPCGIYHVRDRSWTTTTSQALFAGKVAGPDNTYFLPSLHSPFLSMSTRTVKVIQNITLA